MCLSSMQLESASKFVVNEAFYIRLGLLMLAVSEWSLDQHVVLFGTAGMLS